MKKVLIVSLVITLVVTFFTGCAKGSPQQKAIKKPANFKFSNFTFDVDPETFEVFIEKDGVKERASMPLPKMKVSDLKKENNKISWNYPDEKVKVKMEKKENYLDIDIKSTGAKQFEWPKISADSYMLPLGEGKFIPNNDKYWREFLKDETLTFSESFSMRFFTLNMPKYSMVYIAKNMFNDKIHFDTTSKIEFGFSHEFPAMNQNKEYGFRLYVTNNDPVHVAQIYKNYIQEKGEFKTLKEKAKENPNIKKLYGAPHIYLWNDEAITEENIHWNQLKQQLNGKLVQWIKELLSNYSEDGSNEFEDVILQVNSQEYIDKYQKNVIVIAINQVLKLEQFYNEQVFQHIDADSKKLIKKGIGNLSEQELYELNKGLLKDELKDSVDEIEMWGKKESTDLLDDMYESGIEQAWVGLPNWANGLMNPDMVQEANQLGYLIGPYDSYHSIHQKTSKDWNTASFKDETLYDQATITGENGEKIKGFLKRGRKLNPTLTLPSVKQRVDDILREGIPFNSWFVDCDATGEFYDDYSPEHITTQEQDMKARLKRMDYIAKEKHMVVGSEGGNDYTSNVIAFAHGLETPVIKWGDPDMRENKNSPYYVGGYWSQKGTVPERYSKRVPIKELYKHIYLDPAYSLPLYKLVYNDSVITTHHWEWGSLKIKVMVDERRLYEFLYNVPPLYHLDKQEWDENKDMIVSHVKDWSPFHRKAVTKQMTGFKILSKNRLVQSTEFDKNLKVVANFSDKDFIYNNETIQAKSVVIYEGNSKKVYEPLNN
ncbi:glycoside hydrolase [Peribacillus simplex]